MNIKSLVTWAPGLVPKGLACLIPGWEYSRPGCVITMEPIWGGWRKTSVTARVKAHKKKLPLVSFLSFFPRRSIFTHHGICHHARRSGGREGHNRWSLEVRHKESGHDSEPFSRTPTGRKMSAGIVLWLDYSLKKKKSTRFTLVLLKTSFLSWWFNVGPMLGRIH